MVELVSNAFGRGRNPLTLMLTLERSVSHKLNVKLKVRGHASMGLMGCLDLNGATHLARSFRLVKHPLRERRQPCLGLPSSVQMHAPSGVQVR